ncbi:MAG: hypothetical protein NVV73_05040 [Cellvibrionaceae bacterium]|nr:hypothetical protein [Cellvibrionaceae bacterium]
MLPNLTSRVFEHQVHSDRRGAQNQNQPRKYQYKTLMQVDVFNTFYNESDERCTDLRIYPTEATQSFMQSLGLLFRERDAGFSILYNEHMEEKLIQYLRKHSITTTEGQLEHWSKLSFIAALDNPLFVNFTDMPFNMDLSARNIYLSNRKAHLEDNEIILNENTYVSSRYSNFIEVIPSKYAVPYSMAPIENPLEPPRITTITATSISGETVLISEKQPSVEIAYLDFTTVPEGRYTINWLSESDVVFQKPVIYTTACPTPLCFIDLLFSQPTQNDSGIYPVDLESPKGFIRSVLYNLKFKARDVHWMYWVISSLQPVENMRIKPDGGSAVTFYGPVKGSIPTGQIAWSFLSDKAIPMQERSPLRFKLVDRLNCRCDSLCDCTNRMVADPLPLASCNQILNASLPNFLTPSNPGALENKKYSEVYVYI